MSRLLSPIAVSSESKDKVDREMVRLLDVGDFKIGMPDKKIMGIELNTPCTELPKLAHCLVVDGQGEVWTYGELEARVKALHPYDVPEVVALPIEAGSAFYLAWVEAETKRDQ